jgi:prophage regulatory protein
MTVHQTKGCKMQYLSFKDLQAKLGGRGRSTIYRDVDLGRLPKPIKIGSRLYWNEAEIDATLQASPNA